MQNPFYRWYKGNFDRLSETPPADSWEQISRALEGQKPVATGGGAMLKKLGLASLLVAVSAGAGYFIGFESGSNMETKGEKDPVSISESIPENVSPEFNLAPVAPEKNKEVAAAGTQTENGIYPGQAEETAEQLPVQKIVSTDRTINNDEARETAYAEEQKRDSEVRNEIIGDPEPALEYFPSLTGILTANEFPETVPATVIRPDEETYRKPGIGFFPSGFFLGANIALNNYWLLNYDTYNGFKRSELNQVKLNFGLTYGFAGGYRFENGMAVQGEWIQASKQGQKYIEYREGHFLERDVALFYHQANLFFKKGHTRMIGGTTQMISVNLLGGTHLALLTSAEEFRGSQNYFVTEHYKKFSYGLSAGVEAELLTKYNVLFSLGLRGSAGLNNVFAGNDKTPADFMNTRNAALSVNAGISYLISDLKKKK